jgi:diketogulonate reductase-like aldo/keto reductase
MDKLNLQSTQVLHNGFKIPLLGFGTYKMHDDDIKAPILTALEAGYRLIDTAAIYGNESGIGAAIKTFGIPKEEVFITTKVWNEDQGYESTLKSFNSSLERLQMDYVDLYLIHWPFINWETKEHKRKETWAGLEQIYSSGKAKAIGVCNFAIKHLEEMKSYAKVLPMVNQFEMHPFYLQPKLLEYCKENQIITQSWSPLTQNKRLRDVRITAIAQKYNKTNAQILLRWNLQHDSIVIPKSTHLERIKENTEIFDFEISKDDMALLNGLNTGQKSSTWDPDLVP